MQAKSRYIVLFDDHCEDILSMKQLLHDLPVPVEADCVENFQQLLDHLDNRLPDFIIVYSSLTDLQNIEFCYREGSNLYAIKPHTLTELKTILEKIFTIDWKKVLYFPPRSMFVLNPQ